MNTNAVNGSVKLHTKCRAKVEVDISLREGESGFIKGGVADFSDVINDIYKRIIVKPDVPQ
jgi:hypothetical protein